jgi:hypothetical protein
MSFAKIHVKPDTLDDENRKFAQRSLDQPLFLNSIPKGGSHLLRNIIRMFVPVESQYQAEFIQYQFLPQHRSAFEPGRKMLSWGHMVALDASRSALAGARHILLVRDPYDWVLARARFFLSDEFQVGLDHLKQPDVPVETILNLMIDGTKPQLAPLAVTYMYNAVAWLDDGVKVVRYEDLVDAVRKVDSDVGEAFFDDLLAGCGIGRPGDWRERVRIGADPAQSGTARQNLSGMAQRIPDELPMAQKQLVDLRAPGLRRIFGYEPK